MKILVLKEFVQTRTYLAIVAGVLATVVAIGLTGGDAEGADTGLLAALVITCGLLLPQLSFQLEERGHTMVFIRTLPLSPWQIVGSKYVLVAVVIAVNAVVLVLAGIGPGGFIFAASLVAAVTNLLHYRFGVKGATTALMLVSATLSLLGVAVLILTARGNLQPGAFRAVFRAGASVGRSPLVAIAAAVALLGLSYLAAGLTFARRDISRMP